MSNFFRNFSYVFLIFLFFSGALAIGNSKKHGLVTKSGKDSYDVLFYHLNLDVSDSSTYIQGSVSIMLRPVEAELQQVILDCSALLNIDSVCLNQTKTTFTHTRNELIVDLPVPVSTADKITVRIFYHGLGKKVDVTSGIYNTKSASTNNFPVTWTLSEPFSALNWFPCKQVLTDKADSVYVFLSTDKNLKAGSNGLLTAQVPLPGNRIRYEWKSRYPIDYYLISFTVSDFMDYSYYVRLNEGKDSLLVQNYIYNDSALYRRNKENIDKTGDLIVLYSSLFGDYPFKTEKYGHCMAAFGGGMEHQTMTTLINFSFLLVAHELTHQWFGDAVTCGNWQDIWINEGFASYGEYLAEQYLKSQADADAWMINSHEYIKSQSGGSVYVPDSDAGDEDRIFDSRLSYKKGAALLHMIRQEIDNDSIFFQVLRDYVEKYRNKTATGTDFNQFLSEKTGIDFEQFFNQWYYGEGYPIHSIEWHQEQDTLYINSLQTTSTSATPFFNLLMQFRITFDHRDTLVTFRQNHNYSSWKMVLPGEISLVDADPNNYLLTDVSGVFNTNPKETQEMLRVIPNPASEKIKIQFNNARGSYTVYLIDALGKIIENRTASEQNTEVNVHGYPSGMYFVVVKNGNASYTAKFIINKRP